jgi:LmbE family N-acetylglucosaminyl deacetylase
MMALLVIMALVISPHLDDAVFSCGAWLAAHPGSTVATVFAGVPADRRQSTGWDERCGFRHAEEAMLMRRREDRQALAALQARPLWLDFCDRQYGPPPSPQQVGEALERLLRELRPAELLLPLGLFHSDHLLAHEAAACALRRVPAATVWAYEDVPYRAQPGLLQQRLAALAQGGLRATPAPWPGDESQGPRKQRAVRAYASQLRAFGTRGLDDVWRPERLWALDGAWAGGAAAPFVPDPSPQALPP